MYFTTLDAVDLEWWWRGVEEVEIVLFNVLQLQPTSEGPAKFPCNLLEDPEAEHMAMLSSSSCCSGSASSG